ncbi:hypothetical protein D3C80_2093060 [compost metagenome]
MTLQQIQQQLSLEERQIITQRFLGIVFGYEQLPVLADRIQRFFDSQNQILVINRFKQIIRYTACNCTLCILEFGITR